MSPEVLFAAIGDTPEQIKGLRKLAVAMAITGQLNGIESSEAAESLLERIERARDDLSAGKRIPNKPGRLSLDEEDLPEGFEGVSRLVPLGELAQVKKGTTPIKRALPGKYPLIVTGPEPASCDQFDFQGPAAIIPLVSSTGHGHASINRLHYRDDQFALGTILAAVFPYDPQVITARFLFEYLTAFKDELLVSRMTGTANVTLTIGRIQEVPVPIISPAVQRKLDELMALLNRLETTRTRRETTRDRLTTASLARLTAPETAEEEFRAHARFALDNLDQLTSRREQIKILRQTILNLAVRGKLVQTAPTDEPLPRIDKGLPSDTEAPFEIPEGWQWSRLRSLGALKGGGTPSKARDDFWNGHIPWVSPKDMKLDYLDAAQLSITDAAVAGSAVNLIESESILFVVRGMILAHSFPVAIAKVPLTINQDMKAIILKKPQMAEYVLRALKGLTPEMLARVQRSSHGTCRIEGSDYGDFLIPLPPLAEQRRIVAKVDALINLCDRLEGTLSTADNTRDRLLQGLVQEGLQSLGQDKKAA